MKQSERYFLAGWLACSLIVSGNATHWSNSMWLPFLGAGVVLPLLFLGFVWIGIRRQESKFRTSEKKRNERVQRRLIEQDAMRDHMTR